MAAGERGATGRASCASSRRAHPPASLARDAAQAGARLIASASSSQQPREPGRAVDDDVGRVEELGRRLGRTHADAHRVRERRRASERARARRTRRGRRRRRPRTRPRLEARRTAPRHRALVDRHRRAQLHRHPPGWSVEPGRAAAAAAQAARLGRPLGAVAPVDGDRDRALALDQQRRAARLGRVGGDRDRRRVNGSTRGSSTTVARRPALEPVLRRRRSSPSSPSASARNATGRPLTTATMRDRADERGERVAGRRQRDRASGSSTIGASEPSKSTSTAASDACSASGCERGEHAGGDYEPRMTTQFAFSLPGRRRARDRLDLRRARRPTSRPSCTRGRSPGLKYTMLPWRARGASAGVPVW